MNGSVKLIYLLPYSPDLNLIGESFSFMKSCITQHCQHGAHFNSEIKSGQKDEPILFLYEARNMQRAGLGILDTFSHLMVP